MPQVMNTAAAPRIGTVPLAVAKAVLHVALLAPLAWLVWAAFSDGLGANPVEEITHHTGEWALRALLLTLCVTPLRRMTGWNGLARLRRMVGLYAFLYLALHFLTYALLDASLDLGYIAEDVLKRPYITVGFTSFCLLVPLALTSTDGMMRRLGGRRWRQLHRLILHRGRRRHAALSLAGEGRYARAARLHGVAVVLLVLRLPRAEPWLQRIRFARIDRRHVRPETRGTGVRPAIPDCRGAPGCDSLVAARSRRDCRAGRQHARGVVRHVSRRSSKSKLTEEDVELFRQAVRDARPLQLDRVDERRPRTFRPVPARSSEPSDREAMVLEGLSDAPPPPLERGDRAVVRATGCATQGRLEAPPRSDPTAGGFSTCTGSTCGRPAPLSHGSSPIAFAATSAACVSCTARAPVGVSR